MKEYAKMKTLVSLEEIFAPQMYIDGEKIDIQRGSTKTSPKKQWIILFVGVNGFVLGSVGLLVVVVGCNSGVDGTGRVITENNIP